MTLTHRGLKIELVDDDARIPVIEALLFGRTLPPPLPVPASDAPPVPPADPVTAPEPTPPPKVLVPAAVRLAWERLPASDRKELVELTNGPRSPMELEKLLGFRQPQLMGQHSRISRVAFALDVPLYILSSGRGREARKFSLHKDMVPFVRALAEEDAAVARLRAG